MLVLTLVCMERGDYIMVPTRCIGGGFHFQVHKMCYKKGSSGKMRVKELDSPTKCMFVAIGYWFKSWYYDHFDQLFTTKKAEPVSFTSHNLTCTLSVNMEIKWHKVKTVFILHQTHLLTFHH